MSTARPALDPELREFLARIPLPTGPGSGTLAGLRRLAAAPVEPLLAHRSVERREFTVPAADGTGIPLTVLAPADHDRTGAAAPCVYWMHGGGMVMGDRFSQLDIPLEWLDEFGVVVATVDYRLAPEHEGQVVAGDCYRGLCWIAENAAELGIDPDRIVVAGASAGGGLAAGVALRARDLGTPAVAGQILVCPMLDHRGTTVSSRQYSGVPGVWTGEMNAFAWRSVLGATPADEVSPYVSPARAEDLGGLPAAYVDSGSAEVFRDECTDYATRLWAAGGDAELHVWAGGCHGFDALHPRAELSVTARRTRAAWLARLLSRS
ncbi:alpha/beta hydrolase fold domain-containing protein [Kitasatospora purpeofusca]|uniref:alpha/beta hydrolase fold domain-containing protein n=1 Tax=Kitasatospora purpeofusca TaxID=67352 RepID=UPI003816320F